MATETRPSSIRLEAALESLLSRLRRRIRAYIWADGLAVTLAFVLGGFWLSLGFDWVFEPPRAFRLVILGAAVAGLAYVVYRFLLSRLLVRLADRNMAVLLERRFGQFRDSLMTAVEMSQDPRHAADFNPDMLAHTHRDALRHAASVELGDVFNTRPLARRISLAVALVIATAVFAFAAPDALATWARRSLLLSEELWPRKTHLSVEGFDENGHIKIARGSDWELIVKADAALGRAIPEIVEVRYSTVDGARGRENMSRQGVVAPGQAPHQSYAYAFKSVLAPLEFYVLGGDDREGPFHLDVVDSPTISRMTLHCEYPAYMRRAPRDIPVAGLMQLPRGTQITILAAANKPLVNVQIDDVADENAPVTHQLEIAEEHGGPQDSFEFSLPQLDGDKTLLFTLRDSDGIRSREAVRLALTAIADEPPQVNVQLKSIGTAITANAQLPAAGEIADDYGVAKIWFEYHVDEAAAEQRPFPLDPAGKDKLPVTGVFEARDLQLEPKQKLHWAVQAADGFALDGGPNVGSSQKYVLDVVTPEQLRSMLEARELMLRRRFETIVEEFTDTRNLLAGTELSKKSTDAAPADEKDKRPARESTRAPGDPEEKEDRPAAQDTVRQTVQLERVLQNSQRAAHETLQVAVAFDDIREEMINNRIDTEELKSRLKEGVADPLKKIVETMFPKLEEELKKLSAQRADSAAPATQAAALAQMDAILVEMKQVLDKMLELETFNEVLDMLRQIITAQEKVNADTKEKQKQKVRDLVE